MDIQYILAIIVLTLIFSFLIITYLRRKADFNRALNIIFLSVLIPKKESDLDEKKETIKDFKEQISIMEQLLASLKSLYSGSWGSKLYGQDYISFEYVAYAKEINFIVVVPKKAKILVEKQITGFYPDAIIEEIEEINIFKDRKVVKIANIELSKPYYLPIKTYQKLESDPINNLTNTLSKLGQNDTSVIQILLKPIKDDWREKQDKIDEAIKKGFKGFTLNPLKWIVLIIEFLSNAGQENKDKDKGSSDKDADKDSFIKEKGKKTGYEVIIRVVVTGDDELYATAQLKNITSALIQYTSPDHNSFKVSKYINTNILIHNYIFRYFRKGLFCKKIILNIEEIASLFHFPQSRYNKTPEIKWQGFKIIKAPSNLPKDGILMGFNIYRGVKTEVRMSREDRFRHFYVIGQTGTGKTTMLQVMIRQDLKNGDGVAVMDPHGDLASDILPYVPRERADDVIYFNPADTDRPMGINLLEAENDDEKQTVAQDAMNIMLKLFGNEIFGPRIQDYFRNGVLTLMDYPGGGAITDLIRLFTDDDFQKERINSCKNPIVKSWWHYTFVKMGEREKGEMIPFWAAKFGGFVTNTMMRNIVGQVKSSFDIANCMQSGKILLINLSKGVLGDINSNLLGLIMVSKIQMAALRRQLIEDKSQRKDFFLYIDEFQNYITDSIESVLSEARKYRLSLNIAHQYLAQLEKSDALTKSNVNLKSAIFGNVGSVMSYKISPDDAEFMAKQFAPNYSEQDLINMDKRKGIIKLSIDQQPTPAFNLIPLNPYVPEWDNNIWAKKDLKLAKAYKELSRLKYGRDREFVDKEILFRIGGA